VTGEKLGAGAAYYTVTRRPGKVETDNGRVVRTYRESREYRDVLGRLRMFWADIFSSAVRYDCSLTPAQPHTGAGSEGRDYMVGDVDVLLSASGRPG